MPELRRGQKIGMIRLRYPPRDGQIQGCAGCVEADVLAEVQLVVGFRPMPGLVGPGVYNSAIINLCHGCRRELLEQLQNVELAMATEADSPGPAGQ